MIEEIEKYALDYLTELEMGLNGYWIIRDGFLKCMAIWTEHVAHNPKVDKNTYNELFVGINFNTNDVISGCIVYDTLSSMYFLKIQRNYVNTEGSVLIPGIFGYDITVFDRDKLDNTLHTILSNDSILQDAYSGIISINNKKKSRG